jgi:hypothetical protein
MPGNAGTILNNVACFAQHPVAQTIELIFLDMIIDGAGRNIVVPACEGGLTGLSLEVVIFTTIKRGVRSGTVLPWRRSSLPSSSGRSHANSGSESVKDMWR